ncbi:MAG: glycosyltransferase family 4 protein [Bacteroidia bacterium]|nr:glycosyltransferase family 4 protein [Bacteroidia bacterium]
MKIAVNARFLLPHKLEGIGIFTFEVMRRLAANYPNDEFHFFFDRPYDAQFLTSPNIIPHVVYPPARHPFLFWIWFEWAVTRKLKQIQADVFFSADGFLSLRTKVPEVLVTHDLAVIHHPEFMTTKIGRWYYKRYTPLFINKATVNITVSEYSRQDIETTFGLPERSVLVACNGVNPIFQPISESEKQLVRNELTNGRPYFLYVGAIHPRKNIANLLVAFDLFKIRTNAPHCLVIVGRKAWDTKQTEQIYQNMRHKETVHFTGYIEPTTLPRLYSAAEALTYVSLLEGFGIPILEAMHCETAVITSNCTSMPEVAGDAALIVDPYSVESISQAMETIVSSSSIRQKLIEKGKIRCQNYSWEKAAEVCRNGIELATN